LLYDTICARLDPTFNYNREYNRYGKDATRRARKRVRRAIQRRLRGGPTDSDYATIEALSATAGEGLYRLRRLFSAPHDFLQLPYAIEKSVFTVMTALKFAVRAALLTAVLSAVSLGAHG
jgi:hypothetical protein